MKIAIVLLALTFCGGCATMPLTNNLGEFAPDGATGFNGWTIPVPGGATVDAVDTITLKHVSGPQLGAIRFGIAWTEQFPILLEAGKNYRAQGAFSWIGTPPPDSAATTNILFRVAHYVVPGPGTTDDVIIPLEVTEDFDVIQPFNLTFTAVGYEHFVSFDGLLIQGLDLNAGSEIQLKFHELIVTKAPVPVLDKGAQRVHIEPRKI